MRTSEKPSSKLFLEQYTPAFVSRWDELIDWKSRRRSEDGFFERLLSNTGARKVLDIACGTGYHTINLRLTGFEVTGADGSANMLSKAQENANRYGLGNIRFVETEWASLSESFPGGNQFDAIVCLGNAFTHLFEEHDRVAALKEIYSLLNPGGIAIIDHRNYDSILEEGFSSKHQYYYLGDTVDVRPAIVHPNTLELEYNYEDGETHFLTLFPLRQEYLTGLLRRTGFASVVRYGDFEEDYDALAPDFIVQVATKT